MTTQNINTKIIPVLESQGVLKAALFGSVVRGEETEKSDIDILVQLEKGKTLLDLIRLEYKLEDKLGKKVDLLTYGSIHPLLKDIILNEQQIIYEKKP